MRQIGETPAHDAMDGRVFWRAQETTGPIGIARLPRRKPRSRTIAIIPQ